MSLTANTAIYALRNDILIYSEPSIDSERIAMTNPTKNSYTEWKAGAKIGRLTGRMAVVDTQNEDENFIEVIVELGRWRKRLVDWVREDVIGYLRIGEKNFAYFPPKGVPLKNDNDLSTLPQNQSNDSTKYILIGFVVVIVLLLIYKRMSSQ